MLNNFSRATFPLKRSSVTIRFTIEKVALLKLLYFSPAGLPVKGISKGLALREPWLALPAVDEPLFLKQV